MLSIGIIKKFIFIFALISFFTTFLMGGRLICLLPIVYGLLVKYAIPNNISVGGGFITMIIVLSLRYILYPYLYVTEVKGDDILFPIAILLMLVEIFVIFIVIRIFYKIYKPDFKTISTSSSVSSVIPIMFIFIIILGILLGEDLFANKHFVFSYGVEDKITEDDIVDANVMTKLVEWGQIFLIIFIISIFHREYIKQRTIKWIFLSLVVLLSNCLFVLNDSRLSLLVPVVTAISVLFKLFGNKAKIPILGIVVFMISSLTLVSLVKFFGETTISDDTNMFSESLINAYFGGVNNVIIGIKTFVIHGIQPELIYIDAFRGAMGISKYFTGMQGTAAIYNDYIYGGSAQDQIIPTVTQGLLYFGPLFFWLTTVIMVSFVLYGDYRWSKATNCQDAYIWAYCTIIVGWAVPGNMNHLFINVTNSLLPLLFLSFVNKLFKR